MNVSFKSGLGWSILLLLLGACASDGGMDAAPGSRSAGLRPIDTCKSGDVEVDTEAQCIQDDGACYQISNGNWCTGERGTTCPSGSHQVPKNGPCPSLRCFDVSESLRCGI